MTGSKRQISKLLVSENKRFLIREDGDPFFWLGDTAWELFHRLSREDAAKYLKNRADNYFNVIQAVALAEFDGIQAPNYYGSRPLLKNKEGEYDPSLPAVVEGDYDYWDHVDFIVKEAERLGLYAALLPTWGDKYHNKWGMGPVVFNDENARIYGEWLGTRYREQKNIIWVLGGDRPLEEEIHYRIIRAMAGGLKEGDRGKHLITFHPCGGHSSSEYLHDEDWLDFNMIQSGHRREAETYSLIAADYRREPFKPVLDGEPRYEDHPISFKPENGYYDDADIRQAAYWAVLAGSFGLTYGHHSIWSMTTDPHNNERECYFILTWEQAVNRPGGSQMKYLRKLFESRPALDLVPAQDLLLKQYEGQNHLQAARGRNYAFIYTPTGQKLEVALGRISGERVRASWYNPRNGETLPTGEYDNRGNAAFFPPEAGRGYDWVLVLDDTEAGFAPPGKCSSLLNL